MQIPIPIPTLTLTADVFLKHDSDMGQILQEWVQTSEVQTYLQSEARSRLSNPLLQGSKDRPIWEAFAMLPLVFERKR